MYMLIHHIVQNLILFVISTFTFKHFEDTKKDRCKDERMHYRLSRPKLEYGASMGYKYKAWKQLFGARDSKSFASLFYRPKQRQISNPPSWNLRNRLYKRVTIIADIRVPGVARGFGCVGVAFGPPTTDDAAGLYALISCPPRGRVLLPPT